MARAGADPRRLPLHRWLNVVYADVTEGMTTAQRETFDRLLNAAPAPPVPVEPGRPRRRPSRWVPPEAATAASLAAARMLGFDAELTGA